MQTLRGVSVILVVYEIYHQSKPYFWLHFEKDRCRFHGENEPNRKKYNENIRDRIAVLGSWKCSVKWTQLGSD